MSLETNNDGSDIFWPGYVDAVTNLVLNLLFMLTIMIVAVFMFALELSKHKNDVPAEQNVSQVKALQDQIKQLKQQVQNQMTDPQKIVTAKTPLVKSEKDLENMAITGGGLIVHFLLDSVTLSQSEADTLKNALTTLTAKGEPIHIQVAVPAGFSEAKRIGFYRVMAVRNQLIALKVPADQIEVAVHEGKSSSDNTKVLVSAHR